MNITYHDRTDRLDWEAIRRALIGDDFHNGRTTNQLRRSFENSLIRSFAMDEETCIGTARALSDGVGNAYVVDVWTQSSHRGHGIGKAMMYKLLAAGPGQHFYLQTDPDTVTFYEELGFKAQPAGMSLVQGEYLQG